MCNKCQYLQYLLYMFMILTHRDNNSIITTIILKMFTLLTNLATFFQSSVEVVAPSPCPLLVMSLPVSRLTGDSFASLARSPCWTSRGRTGRQGRRLQPTPLVKTAGPGDPGAPEAPGGPALTQAAGLYPTTLFLCIRLRRKESRKRLI